MLKNVLLPLIALAIAACTPATVAPQATGASPGRWEVMSHIRFAVFSARGDMRAYDLTFSCDASDRVRVYYVVAPEQMSAAPQLVLSSGRASETLTAEQYENRMTPPPVIPAPPPGPIEGYTIMGDIALNAPVLAAFQQTGVLEVTNGRASLDASADSNELALLRTYFGRCGS